MTRTVEVPVEHRRLMRGAALFTLGLLDLLLLLLLLFEDRSEAAGAALLLLPVHLLWLYVLERLHRAVEVDAAGLRLRAWWGAASVSADELLGWEDDPALILHTPTGPRRLRLGGRELEAAVAVALDEVFPGRPGRAARWIAAGLPLRLERRPSVLWGTAAAGLAGALGGALGLGGLGLGLARLADGTANASGPLVGGGAVGLIAALLLWVALSQTVLSWDFGPRELRVRTALGTRVWPAAALRAIELRSEPRTHRGFTWICWRLELRFEGPDGVEAVEPGENGLHLDGHSPQADKALLEDLGAALRRLYGLG